MIKKAAVVIGVDQTSGNLVKLKSAASGAETVAAWLKDQGYDVVCCTDKTKSVTSMDVAKAIAQFVTLQPRYNLLIIYFSGHGFWHARSDHWLLSGAPIDASQAINLDGAMDLAKYSGIPNVVFISDACRSIPDSRVGAYVNGIDAFPNFAEISTNSKIDVIKATSEVHAAFEVDIKGEPHSVLTYALRSAYREPTNKIIMEIVEGTEQIVIVPNRKLELYLQDKVNQILADIDINLSQTIEIIIPSSDKFYIARVDDNAIITTGGVMRSKSSSPPDFTVLNVGIDAANTIRNALNSQDHFANMMVSHFDTNTALNSRYPDTAVDHFESFSGFTIRGAKIRSAVVAKMLNNTSVEILNSGGEDTAAVVRLWNASPATSVIIQLENGYYAVLAGLDGYIGHASFDEIGLVNVSYVPSSNGWRWEAYKNRKNQLDRMRALVALAVDHNTFQLHSEAEAEALSSQIRMVKVIDPTLGLYAAHAYSQAEKDDSIQSIRDYMRDDLNVDLFDIQVLTSRCKNEYSPTWPVVPFCPMLTQTWNLLRPRGFQLPFQLEEAKPYLCNSLWTTFAPGAGEIIRNAIETEALR